VTIGRTASRTPVAGIDVEHERNAVFVTTGRTAPAGAVKFPLILGQTLVASQVGFAS
jgi:hypothetical protein